MRALRGKNEMTIKKKKKKVAKKKVSKVSKKKKVTSVRKKVTKKDAWNDRAYVHYDSVTSALLKISDIEMRMNVVYNLFIGMCTGFRTRKDLRNFLNNFRSDLDQAWKKK